MQTALRVPAITRSLDGWARGLMAAVMSAGAWAASAVVSEAEARDNVYWSIGIQSPGVAVGVANAPPVVYGPPAYYYQPRPVVVYPRPVVVAPQPIYHYDDHRPRHWKKDRHWHKGHGHGYGRGYGRGHDRWDD